jgi:glycosyltransferase involved in cell wall biosynthesis
VIEVTQPMGDRIDVAVNLLWIAPGRVGGSEQFLERQLLGLSAPDIRLTVYCTTAFAAVHPDLAERHLQVLAPGGQDWRGGRIAAEHTWLALRTRHADVVHHGGGTTPLVGRRPIVLTVHDLQYLTFPRYFSRARRAYLDAMMPRSVARASVVTVPTEYVRGTVVDAFGVDPARVVVVPHGIPAMFDSTPADLAAVRRRAGLADRPYVVYPAITHPHKGHRVLIEMLDHLDEDVQLVLLGGEGAAESAVRSAVDSSVHGARVHRLGRVEDHERDALLAHAEALVFPSEYEGFGAPLVEAMALGTPVVCSAAPAVTEVVADAAVVVSAPDGAAWAEAVTEARERRHELAARGHARRADFTLARSGAAVAAAYRLAVAGSAGTVGA